MDRARYKREWNQWNQNFGQSWSRLGGIRESRVGQYTNRYRWVESAGTPQSLGRLAGWWDDLVEWATTCEPPHDPNVQAELSGPPPGFEWIEEEESNLLKPGCADWRSRTWGYEDDVWTGERYRNVADGRVYWTLDLMGANAAEQQEYLNEFLLRTGMTQPETPAPPPEAPPLPEVPEILLPPETPPISPGPEPVSPGPEQPPVAVVEQPWYKGKISWPLAIIGGLGIAALVMLTKKKDKRGRRRR